MNLYASGYIAFNFLRLTVTKVVFELLERQKEGIAIARLTVTKVVFEFFFTFLGGG